MRTLRLMASALVCFAPMSLKRVIYNALFGYRVDRTARIGFSLVMVRKLNMGPGTRIGHLNAIRNLEELCLEEGARIGSLNWICGYSADDLIGAFRQNPTRRSALLLREGAAVTHQHLLDCTDTIDIGAFSTVAGWRCQILTHSIDIKNGVQTSAPVQVGRYCFIGTASILLMGTNLPERCVVYAGAVGRVVDGEPLTLYRGNPLSASGRLAHNSGYFTRLDARVR